MCVVHPHHTQRRQASEPSESEWRDRVHAEAVTHVTGHRTGCGFFGARAEDTCLQELPVSCEWYYRGTIAGRG